MKTTSTITCCLVAFALSTVAIQGQILINGDFELPTPVTGPNGNLFTAGQSFGGWTVSGDTVQQYDTSYHGGTAESGHQFIFLPTFTAESTATISQAVTGLSVGVQYQVSWWSSIYTDAVNMGASSGLVSMGGNTVNIAYNDSTVGLHPGDNTPWIKGQLGFIATSGNMILSLKGDRAGAGSGSFIAFDDVQLTSVPEPAAGAVVSGLALLSFAAWSRRKH